MNTTVNSKIRTRFAPSPTGYLHVGGARTALYAWLYARHHHGQFILRIEDTDRERSTQEAVSAIIEGMQWLGLDYDEGPFYQSERLDRYYEVIQQWLTEGKAYRCYCDKDRLEVLRAQQVAAQEKPRYDGRCREAVKADANAPFVVRFKNPVDGEVVFEDGIHGPIRFANAELDDLIIARSDGMPTYNFTVVVDDYDMRITDVIRGDDHINNTPRQINMLIAMGVQPPRYNHVPMILGSDGKRLSKRHGAVSVLQYREDGYLPHALLNYLVRLGWSHGDQEIFSLEEMVSFFDLQHMNKSPAAFNFEKLQWLNQHYLKTMPPAEIAPTFSETLTHLGIDYTQGPHLADLITAQAERCKTLQEMALRSRYFFEELQGYEPGAVQKHVKADILPALRAILERFRSLPLWECAPIHEVVKVVATEFGLGLGKLAQPLRIFCTGGTVSPPLDQTLWLLGRERCVARIQNGLDSLTEAP